ncbi:DUF7289 family protein [Methanosarcina sp. UBA411]|jgi:hypothetical protein|uniref:DUF7289 family protein n=1 Tax=Methanosarcina sp. UBA411 TaxID=1915589 RepID=UPI0025D58C3B|nr:hypothetical protein [Methanosarcina sp. UBA411]
MKTRKNISKEKAGKSFFNSESGVATVIAAVLLLSIIFAVLVMIRVEYVPEWKIDAEKLHMNEVQKDMTGLKSTADMVSLLMASDSNFSASGFPVTIPFSMGGGEIPIFEPSKSSGTLSVNKECCIMAIIPIRSSGTGSPQIVESAKVVNCGGITYHSNNRKYLDQTLRYENGALILAQGEKSLMKQLPSFNIQETSKNNYTVSIQAIKIIGKPDAVSSNTDLSLRLTGISNNFTYNSSDTGDIDSFNCTIITDYPDAWISYLNETAKNAGLDYGTDYEFERPDSNYVYFEFMPKGDKKLERLKISESLIQADLGAGNTLSIEDDGSPDSGGDEDKPVDEDKSFMELGKWYYFDIFTGTYEGTLISASITNPNMLTDHDEDYSLPIGSFKNYELSSYSGVNDFNYDMGKNGKTLNLTFGFNSFSSFNSTSTPTHATICMIYSFNNSDKPNIVMTLAGTGNDAFQPKDGWCLYNQTLSITPEDPKDITLNLKVNTDNGNDASGTFYIDYLAVYLS